MGNIAILLSTVLLVEANYAGGQQGPLQGSRLEMLPSELVTWGAWRREHPETTVLNLSRTHRDFVKDFYRRPERFVYGLIDGGRAYAIKFPLLLKRPVLNLDLSESALLVSFDPDSTAARVFDRTPPLVLVPGWWSDGGLNLVREHLSRSPTSGWLVASLTSSS